VGQAPLWLHGDLHSADILVHRGRISGVIDFGDQEHGGGVGPMPYRASRPGSAGGRLRDHQLIETLELAVKELGAPPEFAQGDLGG
jgi:Phosphotransferase enzyme family